MLSLDDSDSQKLDNGTGDIMEEFQESENKNIRCKRDSGYGTDVSSPCRRLTFTYDTGVSELGFSEDFGNMNLDNDVFEDNCGQSTNRYGLTFISDSDGPRFDLCNDSKRRGVHSEDFDDNSEQDSDVHTDCETDAADREVEELLSHSLTLKHDRIPTRNTNVTIVRPSAPVPGIEMPGRQNDIIHMCGNVIKSNTASLEFRTSVSCDPSPGLNICRQCQMRYFVPISSCENNHRESDDISRSAFNSRLNLNSLSGQLPKGDGSCRPRTRSECLRLSGPLPDVVTSHTDRPTSLPDLLALQQHHELGKELRRIGDEFETMCRERRRRKMQTVSWSLFNCSLTFHLSGYLGTIRRLLSPSPQETLQNR